MSQKASKTFQEAMKDVQVVINDFALEEIHTQQVAHSVLQAEQKSRMTGNRFDEFISALDDFLEFLEEDMDWKADGVLAASAFLNQLRLFKKDMLEERNKVCL